MFWKNLQFLFYLKKKKEEDMQQEKNSRKKHCIALNTSFGICSLFSHTHTHTNTFTDVFIIPSVCYNTSASSMSPLPFPLLITFVILLVIRCHFFCCFCSRFISLVFMPKIYTEIFYNLATCFYC